MNRNRRSVHDFRPIRDLRGGPVSFALGVPLAGLSGATPGVHPPGRWFAGFPRLTNVRSWCGPMRRTEREGLPERRERRVGRVCKERGPE